MTLSAKQCNVKITFQLDDGSKTEHWWMGFTDGWSWRGFLENREQELRDIVFGLQGGISGELMFNRRHSNAPLYFHSSFLDGFQIGTTGSNHKLNEKLSPSFILRDGMTISVVYRQSIMMMCLNGPYGKKLAKHWLIHQPYDFLMYKRWNKLRAQTDSIAGVRFLNENKIDSDMYSSDDEEEKEQVDVIPSNAKICLEVDSSMLQSSDGKVVIDDIMNVKRMTAAEYKAFKEMELIGQNSHLSVNS
jgi:hypothetical protein